MTYKCIILNIIIEETPFFSVSVLFFSNSYSDFMLCYSQLMHQSSILCPLVCFHGCLIIKFRGRDSLNYAHKDKCSPVCISSMQSPNAVLHLNNIEEHCRNVSESYIIHKLSQSTSSSKDIKNCCFASWTVKICMNDLTIYLTEKITHAIDNFPAICVLSSCCFSIDMLTKLVDHECLTGLAGYNGKGPQHTSLPI